MARKRKPVKQQRRDWSPLQRVTSQHNAEWWQSHGMRPPERAYASELYSVWVRELGNGAEHISFHRHDRAAVRDWRHFQAIKNEVCGPERLAVEVFPPESLLVDTANEYHLWVLPDELAADWPFMIREGLVATQQEGELLLGKTKSRQREWQPGVPTGRGTTSTR